MGLLMLNGHAYAGFTEPAEIYSTEEREIGVWIDGKPLYQKTVHISSLPSSTYTSVSYPHGISNIDIIANYFGVMRWANGQVSKEVRFAMFNSNIDNTYGSDMSIEVDKTDILISVGSNRSSMNADITIQYTKTTDTAGSGKWTTSGVPAHQYSTNEQVVGTWIDGKPIYEKAFILSNSLIISNTAWTSMGILASSINAESYIRCFALSETGTLWDAMNVATINSYIALTSWRNGDTIAVKTVVIQYTKTTDV